MPNEVKLLPCPFCGREAEIEETGGSQSASFAPHYRVNCKVYAHANMAWTTMREEAIAAWNHRPTTVVTDEVVERVARALAACASRHGTLCEGEQPEDSWEAWEEEARVAIASMPTVVTGEQPQGLGAIPGSHPADQAPSGLGASRFDPERGA